jgi:Leucine-rich repeat (LRR) protein
MKNAVLWGICLICIQWLCSSCFKENVWEGDTESDTSTDTDFNAGSDTITDTTTASDSSSETDPADTIEDSEILTDTGSSTDIENGVVPAQLTFEGDGNFGEVISGRIVERKFTLINNVPHSFISDITPELSPADSAFRIEASTCTAPLTDSTTCTLSVRFSADTRGLKSAAVVIRYNNGKESSIAVIPVTGVVLDVARLSVSSETLNFGTVFFYEKGESVLSIINDASDTTATDISIAIDNKAFSVETDCSLLSPGNACDINLTWRPMPDDITDGVLTVSYQNGFDMASASATLIGTSANRCDGAIEFPDFNLEAAIRAAINKPSGVISSSDLKELNELDASEMQIEDLRGLQCITELTTIDFSYNHIADLYPLIPLVALMDINFYQNEIIDISPLAGLADVKYLYLEHNRISDIASVALLSKLIEIGLSYNNLIADLSPLSTLNALRYLGLAFNNIEDISALATLTSLNTLTLNNNIISDISALTTLPNLSVLFIYHNEISDLSPLVANFSVDEGDMVSAHSNLLICSDPQTESDIAELIARGVNLSHDCQ